MDKDDVIIGKNDSEWIQSTVQTAVDWKKAKWFSFFERFELHANFTEFDERARGKEYKHIFSDWTPLNERNIDRSLKNAFFI